MANINLSGSIGATGVAILGSASVANLDAPYTLSVAEYTNNYINVTGTLTAQRNIIAPLTVGSSYIVKNSTTGGYSIQFKGATGTGVLILPGAIVSVISDGTNFNTISGTINTIIQDEGSTISSSVSTLNFIGAGVTATYDGYKALINIPSIIVKNEGTPLTFAPTINFTGTGVEASYNIINNTVDVDINHPDENVEIEFAGYGIIQDGYAEVGQYISNAKFKASYNIIPGLVELTDDDGTPLKNVTSTSNSFSSDGYFQKLSFGEEVNFTLTVDGYYTNTFTIIWGQRNFFGIGPPGNSNPNFILGLNSLINNTAGTIFTAYPSSTDKIYYAHRTAYGLASIFVNGFEGGFTLVSNTISITNPYGFTENYTLYESDNVGLGITSIEVI